MNTVSLTPLFYIKLISNATSKLTNVNLKAEAQWREISILPLFVCKATLESPRHFLIISP